MFFNLEVDYNRLKTIGQMRLCMKCFLAIKFFTAIDQQTPNIPLIVPISLLFSNLIIKLLVILIPIGGQSNRYLDTPIRIGLSVRL